MYPTLQTFFKLQQCRVLRKLFSEMRGYGIRVGAWRFIYVVSRSAGTPIHDSAPRGRRDPPLPPGQRRAGRLAARSGRLEGGVGPAEGRPPP